MCRIWRVFAFNSKEITVYCSVGPRVGGKLATRESTVSTIHEQDRNNAFDCILSITKQMFKLF